MADDLVERLRDLLAAATQGPWQTDDGDCGAWGVFSERDCDAVCYMIEPSMPGYKSLRPEDEANASLITEAVNALPDLLSRIADLQEQVARAREALQPFADAWKEARAAADIAPMIATAQRAVTCEDFRRAATAIRALSPNTNEGATNAD